MEDQLTDYTKATVEGAVKGVVESLGPFLKSIAELITDVCLQKVLDSSGIKIREGFRSQIPSFSLLSNL